MLIATNRKHSLEISELPGERQSLYSSSERHSLDERRLSTSGVIASNKKANLIVRFVYFLNAAIVLIGLGYITAAQKNGQYRCKSVTVLFSEEIWEQAYVRLQSNIIEQRMLIYSSFSGTYKEDGTYKGYPRFVEQNKNDGNPFGKTVTPAEIRYCDEISSWIFMNPNILTHLSSEEERNECSWLWKSPQTDDYELTSTSDSAWDAWIGEVKPFSLVSITCNECSENSDCNYHGSCDEKNACECEYPYFGDSCEFKIPCQNLATEKAHRFDPAKGIQWKQDNPIREVPGRKVYNRPVYIQEGLSGEPYDMRLYKILEKEKSSNPSHQPSDLPSYSSKPTPLPTDGLTNEPTYLPLPLPTPGPTKQPTARPIAIPTARPIAAPTTRYPTISIPTAGTNKTLAPTPLFTRPGIPVPITAFPTEAGIISYPPTSLSPTTPTPTKPLFANIDRDTNRDFEDYDDFFESKPLHNLDEILEDYSVVISYSGSRFYGTIIEPDASFDDLFPHDYHAFWSQSFNINRTFIISDTTFTSTPVGLDFFEMRRRIDNFRNPNVQFSYSPFGVQIPLMSYDGAGFFHCINLTPQPSMPPSFSTFPTITSQPSQTPTVEPSLSAQPSTSTSPTDGCFFVSISILHDDYPEEISWTLSEIASIDQGETKLVKRSDEYQCGNNRPDICKEIHDRVCLNKGDYIFKILDSFGDGIASPGNYALTYYDGQLIMSGGNFSDQETTVFSIPFVSAEP